MRRAELAFALLVVVLMSAAWGLDRIVPAHPIPAAAPAAASSIPISEAWYCPVPSSQGLASTVSTANLGDAPVHIRRSGTGALGAAAEPDLGAGALGSADIAAGTAQALATVEAFGGPTVSHLSVLATGSGAADARCTRQPGTRWLFAEASTAPGYDSYLLVANPFQEEAMVTVRVLGPKGDQLPSGLNNVEIPQLSQTTLFLGDFYPSTQSIGLDVTAARGRVVVSRLMKVSSRDGVRGLTLDVGAPAPATTWLFPGGEVPAQGEEDIVVANPSDHEALVSTVYQVEGGSAPAGSEDVHVPAGTQVVLKVSDQVPGGTRHATVLTSTNDVPLVAERLTVGGSGSGQSFHTVWGATGPATRWVVAAGSAAGGTDTLAVMGDGANKATYRVTLVTESAANVPGPLARVDVGAGQRGTVDLTPYLNGKPAMLLVEAVSGSLAVENDLALPAAYRQTLESAGIPLG